MLDYMEMTVPDMTMTVLIIILAVLAGIVLVKLYLVLGRQIGRQPEPATASAPGGQPRKLGVPADPALDTPAAQSAIQTLKGWDQAFDLGAFMTGAKDAYGRVVQAFAAGDRDTLRPLLAPGVMASFEAALDKRETEARSETVEFLHPPRADLETAKVDGDLAQIAVRFLAELRRRSKGPEGEAVDDQRTAEVWSFERSHKSRDPNWVLVRVDAASA
ncbi:MAG: hypothetical protein JWM33_3855 [Caulobacteraceae bacterium]|nr:hypothetical protein [Caulobacteraceae bacterium]